MEQKRLIGLYKDLYGTEPEKIEKLPGAGSNRQYFRLYSSDAETLIGVIGTSAEENKAFYNLSLLFAARHLPVPKVYDHTDDFMAYLQEDLGSTSLFDYIRPGRELGGDYDETEKLMLQLVIRELPRFQFEGGNSYVFTQCYPQQEMDRTSVMFDLNYFKYCFLKLRGIEFNEYKLQADFERFADDLLMENADTFLYRDFQARNVMLKDGRPFFIDYQGGRKGPIYYDVASFLWQASAQYSEELRTELIDAYWDALQPYLHEECCPVCYQSLTKEHFLHRLHAFVLFRLLQVLGAYGYRGLWEKKRHFIDSIPPALQNLQKEIDRGTCDKYPYLKSLCRQIVKASENQPKDSGGIRVFSFSYKKGIPEDTSGNGGGYVFDCRSSNNPGRYQEYKFLTGLDQPVIDFLEHDGEILQFLSHIYPIIDFHVQRWIDRGFTDLQISFGCTGGQHRSVYCAQHVAEHLCQQFHIPIHLCHREQGIHQILCPPK
ncbi:MAG: phosphotransferase [Bacteroidaceae bacterium]|nr:phosphotransferase [Bacteroidaceae bacterium]